MFKSIVLNNTFIIFSGLIAPMVYKSPWSLAVEENLKNMRPD